MKLIKQEDSLVMKFEERGLPPFINYVNARLSGRPLHAAMWVLLMLATGVAVYRLDENRGLLGDVIIFVMMLFMVVVLTALLSVAIRQQGRDWLLKKHEDGKSGNVSKGSRVIVRLLPVLGVAVAVESYLLRR